MSAELFNRDFAVTVDTVRIAARPESDGFAHVDQTIPTLRVQFKIEKNLFATPNTAEVTIFNLAKETRARLQKKNAQVRIEAGYVNNISEIFHGQMTLANHVKNGPDWQSKFIVGDGIQSVQNGTVSESFGPDTASKDVITHVLSKMGIGVGNSVVALANANFRGKPVYHNGYVVSGKGFEVLTDLIASAGFDWSIQDGEVQLLAPGSANGDTAIKLDQEHGLIGSAEEGENKQKQSVVRVRSLLQAGLRPGRSVVLSSRNINGNFKIESVIHNGDTWGQEWYSDLEMTAL